MNTILWTLVGLWFSSNVFLAGFVIGVSLEEESYKQLTKWERFALVVVLLFSSTVILGKTIAVSIYNKYLKRKTTPQ